ncbi:MAG: PKD domain-containing protein [Acidobacteriota bacterium]|nr:PKD domain-containing protein [Acidobacteriota bacterium]
MPRIAVLIIFSSIIPAALRADVEILTSITDVYYLGTQEKTGTVTLRVMSDFNLPVDQTNPIYFKINLEDGALGRTIVDPTGTHTVAGSGAFSDVPIDLRLKLRSTDDNLEIAPDMPESAVQLIRAIQGETSIWLRITVPTHQWIDSNGDGIGDMAPNDDARVSFTVGVESTLAGNRLSESGFDFSGAANVDTYATFGLDTAAADTSFIWDYHVGGCGTIQPNRLHYMDLIAWRTGVLPGSATSPEGAAYNPVDTNSCTGGNIGDSYEMLPLNFVNDFIVGRTRDESSLSANLIAPPKVKVGESFEVTTQLLGDISMFSVVWDFGDEVHHTATVTTSHTFAEVGEYIVTSTTTNAGGLTATAQATITVAPLAVEQEILNLQAVPSANDEILLTWEAGSNGDAHLDHFDIFYHDVTENRFIAAGSTYGTRFPVPLLRERDHTFKVVPVYKGGATGPEAVVSLTGSSNPITYSWRAPLPHVTQDDSWFTGIAVVNPHDETVGISLLGVDHQGDKVAESEKLTSLGPGHKALGLIQSYFSAEQLKKISWVELRAQKPLSAFELFGQGNKNMTGVLVDNHNLSRGMLPVADADSKRFVGVSVVNPDLFQDADVSFVGLDWRGQEVATMNAKLFPLGKLTFSMEELGQNFRRVSAVRIKSDTPVTGFEIWGDAAAGAHVSGTKIQDLGIVQGALPIVEPGSRIELANVAPVTNKVILEAYSNDGNLMSTRNIELEPNGQISLNTDIVIGNGFYGYLRVISSAPIHALCDLRRDRGDGDILTEAVPATGFTGGNFLFPHVAATTNWGSELALVNLSDDTVNVTLKAYNAEGEVSGLAQKTLNPRGRLHQLADELFPEIQDMAYIRAITDGDALAAHQLFYARKGFGSIMGGTVVKPLP